MGLGKTRYILEQIQLKWRIQEKIFHHFPQHRVHFFDIFLSFSGNNGSDHACISHIYGVEICEFVYFGAEPDNNPDMMEDNAESHTE